jgi:rubrerythrin
MRPTTPGENRTGAASAEDGVRAMLEANERWSPAQPLDTALSDVDRGFYILESDSLGSIPPPVTTQGILKTGFDKQLGERPAMLLDKIGERIAFECSGTRLYDALILKYRALAKEGADAPGLTMPLDIENEDTAAALLRIRTEEHEHFLMLSEVMRSLGGDPTAQTPCGDVSATASRGLMLVVTDPRTTFAQSLNAILIAELADNAGWELLVSLAQEAGETNIAKQFERAMSEEKQHLVIVKSWVASLASTTSPTVAA